MSIQTTPHEEATKTDITPRIVWFEVPADDIERAKYFYSTLFGWKIEKVLGDEYWHIDTGGDENSLDGGLMRRHQSQNCITSYIAVPSLDEFVKRVQDLGGQVCVPRSAVPEMGYFAVCQDTEGTTFALWEKDDKAR